MPRRAENANANQCKGRVKKGNSNSLWDVGQNAHYIKIGTGFRDEVSVELSMTNNVCKVPKRLDSWTLNMGKGASAILGYP